MQARQPFSGPDDVLISPIADIGEWLQTAAMVLLSILIATGATAVSDEAIRLQAARCGLKPHQLVWKRDAKRGRQANISANGNLDSLSYKSVACMVEWAKQSGARIGFIAEPAPEKSTR